MKIILRLTTTNVQDQAKKTKYPKVKEKPKFKKKRMMTMIEDFNSKLNIENANLCLMAHTKDEVITNPNSTFETSSNLLYPLFNENILTS